LTENSAEMTFGRTIKRTSKFLQYASAGVLARLNVLLYPAQRRASMEVDDAFGKVSMSCCISDILLLA
jgi:hypothetical protein